MRNAWHETFLLPFMMGDLSFDVFSFTFCLLINIGKKEKNIQGKDETREAIMFSNLLFNFHGRTVSQYENKVMIIGSFSSSDRDVLHAL